jgi:hypothetical protein
MHTHRMVKQHTRVPLLILFALGIIGRQALAQNLIEFRFADTKYRYADWLYIHPSSLTIDVFYDGVPGSNEFNFGGGYGIKIRKLTVTPLLYFVVGKEASQRGLRLALLATFDKDGWKLVSYLSHFAPLSGGVSHYQSLDTLDFTRVVGKHWEIGMQSGFFHSEGKWNPQNGPLIKLNDRYGNWGASYRFGPQKEFRFIRIFVF